MYNCMHLCTCGACIYMCCCMHLCTCAPAMPAYTCVVAWTHCDFWVLLLLLPLLYREYAVAPCMYVALDTKYAWCVMDAFQLIMLGQVCKSIVRTHSCSAQLRTLVHSLMPCCPAEGPPPLISIGSGASPCTAVLLPWMVPGSCVCKGQMSAPIEWQVPYQRHVETSIMACHTSEAYKSPWQTVSCQLPAACSEELYDTLLPGMAHASAHETHAAHPSDARPYATAVLLALKHNLQGLYS